MKEKLSHDFITVNTELKYKNTDEGNADGGKDEDANYEVTRSDIKILKQIHSLGDEQYKRLMPVKPIF